jgi:hypothetical protein
LLAGFTDANAANARLGAMYAGSLAADIGTAGAAGISMAQGRADERTDRLRGEEREMLLKGDIAGSNYLNNLSNILNIRGQRQNLALSKFQLEQAKREEERQGRGRGGSGSGGSGSGGMTEAQIRAQIKEEERRKAYASAVSGYGYKGAGVGGGLPSMNFPQVDN